MGKITTLGEILVEIMAVRTGQSFREPGQLVGPYPSGAPAIFIDQVARLGQACSIIGCVGDDDFGWLNVERLARDGVDVSAVAVLKGAVTGSAFVTYKDDGDRDFVFNIANSASARLCTSMVDGNALADCTHIHIMGSSLFSSGIIEAMKKSVEIVKGKGGTVSFDPNVRKEMLAIPEMGEALDYVLRHTDIFLPSDHEVTLLVDATTESQAVRRLLALGVKEIVVKHGARGCTLYDANDRVNVSALAVDEIDPTGAGDCFGATYVTCRKLGKGKMEALGYAVASGAHAVLKKGPMEGTAGFAELNELLQSQGRAVA